MKFLLPLIASVFLLSVLFISSCQKDLPSNPLPVDPPSDITGAPDIDSFVVIVDTSYSGGDVDNWLMLHNAEGKLLFAKSFQEGDQVRYESKKDSITGPITVTFMNRTFSATNNISGFHFETFAGTTMNQVWTLKKTPLATSGGRVGSYNITIAGLESDMAIAFYTNFGQAKIEAWNKSATENKITYTISRRENDRNILVMVYPNGMDPKYYSVIDPKPGETYDFSVADLKSYDKVLHVPIKPSRFTDYKVHDQDSTSPYMISTSTLYNRDLAFQDTVHAELVIGYLNNIGIYKTELFSSSDNATYLYAQIGPAPDQINLHLGFDPQISDDRLGKFTFTANESVDFHENHYSTPIAIAFSTGNFVSWSIMSEGDKTYPIDEFPEEWKTLFTVYPDFEQVAYGSTQYFFTSYDYQDFLEGKFHVKPVPSLYTFLNVAIE
jgi:hypothetical protein